MTISAFDAHEYPIYGARYRVLFPILDADGDLVTGATGLDSERSIDCATFADCSNEATELATSSGMYYLDLIQTEMLAKSVGLIIKTTSVGAKTTPMVLYPKKLPIVRTGTAQAGAASTITLDAGASSVDSFYLGCYVNITNNSPANALGQCRRITGYVGSTKVATVEGTWGTNPSSASTFEILATAEATTVIGAVQSVTGAVGSVTGAVGSVTGAVGSVTGNVGGNVTGSIGSLAAQAKTDVNTEVLDVLNVDTFTEPGQEAPGVNVTLVKKIGYLYKFLRNKITMDNSGNLKIYADDASTVDQKTTATDDGTTFTRGEIGTGP